MSSTNDGSKIVGVEVSRQSSDSIDEGHSLDPLVDTLRRGKFQQRPWFIPNHKSLGSRIRVAIPLGVQLEQLDTDAGLPGNDVADGHLLEVGRTIVDAF